MDSLIAAEEPALRADTERHNSILHHAMASVGGFVGGFALLNNADFFGNAQTTNLIHLVTALLGRNWPEFGLRVLGLGLYFAGCFLYVVVRDLTPVSERVLSVILDGAALVMLALMPKGVPLIITAYPAFFAMSFQWCSFSGAYGYNSSTIFSTNNTKQATVSLAEYIIHRDPKKLHRMKFFLGSLLGFHIGVAIAFFATKLAGSAGAFIGLLLLLVPALMLYAEYQPEGDNIEPAA